MLILGLFAVTLVIGVLIGTIITQPRTPAVAPQPQPSVLCTDALTRRQNAELSQAQTTTPGGRAAASQARQQAEQDIQKYCR